MPVNCVFAPCVQAYGFKPKPAKRSSPSDPRRTRAWRQASPPRPTCNWRTNDDERSSALAPGTRRFTRRRAVCVQRRRAIRAARRPGRTTPRVRFRSRCRASRPIVTAACRKTYGRKSCTAGSRRRQVAGSISSTLRRWRAATVRSSSIRRAVRISSRSARSSTAFLSRPGSRSIAAALLYVANIGNNTVTEYAPGTVAEHDLHARREHAAGGRRWQRRRRLHRQRNRQPELAPDP